MSVDPRWELVAACIQELSAGSMSGERDLELLQIYENTLEAIAADPLVSVEDHTTAQTILDEWTKHNLMHTGQAIAGMAQIAADTSIDPNLRQKAQQALQQAAERLRDQGQDISRWSVVSPGGRPH